MNNSLWIDTCEGKRYEKLNEDIKCECLIVGAGIAGITTAYLLSKRGVSVTVVDADYVGYGATGRNTGKITAQHSVIYSKIYKKYGSQKAKKYYEINDKAIMQMEDIIRENNIECDYERVPSYIFSEKEEGSDILLEEFNVCKELGIDCEFLMELPLPIDIKAAIKFNRAAQFHPKKYIDSLGSCVEKLGGKIYEKTAMKSMEIYDDYSKVKSSEGYVIEAAKVIICSHFPFYDGLSFYFMRLKPERSYLVAGEYTNDFPKGIFITSDEPKRSIRYYEDKKLLLIGGESHKVGHDNDEDYYNILKEYGRDVFEMDKYYYEWSAQDYISPDHIPYIGYLNSVKDNIYVATGFAKWGMTNGTAAAMIITDLLVSDKSEYVDTFTPSRTEGYYSEEFLKNNLDVGVQYIKGKVRLASKDMPEKGEAKVVKLHRKKYGAYRDEKEHLHIVDITCTHMGCELNWNPMEKSWDCPCHGSRFSIDGNILEGPATIALNQYGEDDDKNEINPNLL